MEDTRAAPSGRRSRRVLAAALAVGVVGLTAVVATQADAEVPMATATLRDPRGSAVGRVRFFDDHGHTVVRVRLTPNAGVAPEQFHGFHIHVGTDATSGTGGCLADPAKPSNTWFVSAGGHLKEDGQVHAGHTGDLQSLHVNGDGTADSTFTTDRFSPDELAGKAVILHAGADNFGNVPTGAGAEQYTANTPAAVTRTQNTGNAGDRVACGVISGGGRRDD